MQAVDQEKYEKLSKELLPKLKVKETSKDWKSTGKEPCETYKMKVDSRYVSKGVTVVNFSF